MAEPIEMQFGMVSQLAFEIKCWTENVSSAKNRRTDLNDLCVDMTCFCASSCLLGLQWLHLRWNL